MSPISKIFAGNFSYPYGYSLPIVRIFSIWKNFPGDGKYEILVFEDQILNNFVNFKTGPIYVFKMVSLGLKS